MKTYEYAEIWYDIVSRNFYLKDKKLTFSNFYIDALNAASLLGWNFITHKYEGNKSVYIVAKEID
jgi:hypothetical protein